ncbi:hypothetical protein Cadr_000024098 [Camelus dromedarius]|uniref:Uncharacterized protein n=1 Tax=Camelus dromedarius TaxID=9838 RepID=A0A5N4CW62_CAMDR|nr:hypothetical protein Cadr_000024098 [Camelus dromedarius]
MGVVEGGREWGGRGEGNCSQPQAPSPGGDTSELGWSLNDSNGDSGPPPPPCVLRLASDPGVRNTLQRTPRKARRPHTYFLMLPARWRSLHPLRKKRTKGHGLVSRSLPTQLNVFPLLGGPMGEENTGSARCSYEPQTCPARAADQQGRPPAKVSHHSALGIPLCEGRPLHDQVRGAHELPQSRPLGLRMAVSHQSEARGPPKVGVWPSQSHQVALPPEAWAQTCTLLSLFISIGAPLTTRKCPENTQVHRPCHGVRNCGQESKDTHSLRQGKRFLKGPRVDPGGFESHAPSLPSPGLVDPQICSKKTGKRSADLPGPECRVGAAQLHKELVLQVQGHRPKEYKTQKDPQEGWLAGEENSSLLLPQLLPTRNHLPGPWGLPMPRPRDTAAGSQQTLLDAPVFHQVFPHRVGHTQVQVGEASKQLLVPEETLSVISQEPWVGHHPHQSHGLDTF